MSVTLNEKQKQVALMAFMDASAIRDGVYAAVSAVLALEPAGEQCTCPKNAWTGSEPNDSTCTLTEEQHAMLSQPLPTQQDALVEEMCEAWWRARHERDEVNSPHERMTAALAVVRKHYVAIEDVEKAIREELTGWMFHSGEPLESHIAEHIAKKIRDRLTPRKVETPEQRVTIRPVHGSGLGVFEDGLLACPQFFSLRQDAERYKRGLIAELAEKEQA